MAKKFMNIYDQVVGGNDGLLARCGHKPISVHDTKEEAVKEAKIRMLINYKLISIEVIDESEVPEGY